MDKPKRIHWYIAAVCAAVVVIILVGVLASRVYAADQVKRTISSYLDEQRIPYSSVQVRSQVLSVRLISEGDDRCTMQDVEAIGAIYEAVHAQSVAEKIRDVSIEIYSAAGDLLYDERVNDVALKMQDDAALITPIDPKNVTASKDEILQKARDISADTPFAIARAEVSDASEIDGKCIDLTLTLEDVSGDSVNEMRTVYDALQLYSYETGAVTQCSLTVQDSAGECIAYMRGDFQYGNCIAWISPEIEDAFVAFEGPAPD